MLEFFDSRLQLSAVRFALFLENDGAALFVSKLVLDKQKLAPRLLVQLAVGSALIVFLLKRTRHQLCVRQASLLPEFARLP